MTYKKVGGLHFVKIGRFGFSFYFSRLSRCERNILRLRAARKALER